MTKVPTTGAIASAPDYRDAIASASVLAGDMPLPSVFEADLSRFPVLDQNKIPACVGHTFAILMMQYWYKKTGKVVHFSPRFLDILSNEDWIPLDGGRVPRTVAKIAAKYGCCTVDMLPNNTAGLSLSAYRSKNAITDAMMKQAAQFKIGGYVRVANDSISDYRRAIYSYGAIASLMSIDDQWWKPSWAEKDIEPLRTPNPSTSNHEVVVKGWKDGEDIIRNSWSDQWSGGGEARYNASKWLPFIREGWAIADIPADVKRLLSSLPAAADFAYEWRKTLKRGDENEDVKFAQIGLMILGYLAPVPADELGIYGKKTSAAVLAFQKAKKISSPDGDWIGEKTRAALNKQFAL